MSEISDYLLSDFVLAVSSGIAEHIRNELPAQIIKIEFLNNHSFLDNEFSRQIYITPTTYTNTIIIEVNNSGILVYDTRFVKEYANATQDCAVWHQKCAKIDYVDPDFLTQIINALKNLL